MATPLLLQKIRIGRVAIPVLALFWLGVTLLPFVLMVFTSLKSQEDNFASPMWAPPSHLEWGNYLSVLHGSFLLYLRNSVFVIGVALGLTLLFASMAAYALARLRFKGQGSLFGLIVASMIVPLHVTLVPVYLLTRNAGLYDTMFALIGPYVAMSLPVSIFILTEFMRQIPRELEEAARIDGCGPIAVFTRIFLPLSGPGLSTVAIYNGINLWNEFIFAYVLTSSPNHRTLPLAVWDFQSEFAANIPGMMAVVTLTALPLIVAYAFGQEKIVKGMMAGALKG
ncbi:carbohydrate ABC transporter permease [Amantichitinum ursilacus]|uniref:Inner membrane ABC transporter permease protein YcjP n=1 Tax=Amantichitinum ursilacus TaxID=857265 RepID=A0A0N0GL71_9NEIS|nr:carbohydrate ABC transporter permease [Amantichitinum ursilacus]KPC49575.1 Inner membrane ABC transporter permease protein YcjP [Amantichitinum ursilacus]